MEAIEVLVYFRIFHFVLMQKKLYLNCVLNAHGKPADYLQNSGLLNTDRE